MGGFGSKFVFVQKKVYWLTRNTVYSLKQETRRAKLTMIKQVYRKNMTTKVYYMVRKVQFSLHA